MIFVLFLRMFTFAAGSWGTCSCKEFDGMDTSGWIYQLWRQTNQWVL